MNGRPFTPPDPIIEMPAGKLSAGRRLTIRNQTDLARGRHPATGRPLIDGHRCGQCTHFVNSPPYFKCDRHRLGRSSSAASDIRKSWPACDLLQANDHAARSGRCECGAPLDATVHHDDTSDGHQTCVDCCQTCNTQETPT